MALHGGGRANQHSPDTVEELWKQNNVQSRHLFPKKKKYLKVKTHFNPTPFSSSEKDSRVVGSVSAWSCLTKSGLQQGEPRPKKKVLVAWVVIQSFNRLSFLWWNLLESFHTFSNSRCWICSLSANGTYAHSDICRISPDYEYLRWKRHNVIN